MLETNKKILFFVILLKTIMFISDNGYFGFFFQFYLDFFMKFALRKCFHSIFLLYAKRRICMHLYIQINFNSSPQAQIIANLHLSLLLFIVPTP